MLKKDDNDFDRMVDDLGYLRLSSPNEKVYHLGNVLTDRWKEEAKNYNFDNMLSSNAGNSSVRTLSYKTLTETNVRRVKRGVWTKKILRNKLVHKILLRVYTFFFRLVYTTEK